jgi:hypothetical protein
VAVPASRTARRARSFWVAVLLVGLAAAAAGWFRVPAPASGPEAGPTAALVTTAAPPRIAEPVAQPPDPAAMPELRVPPTREGQDPFIEAVRAAREAPHPPPPAAIAQASTFPEAFEAMRAAQGDPPPGSAGLSPFASSR